jgi:protein phosphatase
VPVLARPDGLAVAVSAITDPGRVRSANQDAYGYSAEGQFFALCDGMGGAAGGEIASRLTIDTVLERLGATALNPERLGATAPTPAALAPGAEGLTRSIPRQLEDAVAAANRILFARAEREPALSGMGTTLVALLVRGARAWVMHVGDSRCYRLRAGTLTRCTEDHSLVGEQVRLGILSPEEAEQSPLRNVITRAVGVREGLRPEVRELEVAPGDMFLLCSDGLTRELQDARIAELLAGARHPEEACRMLIDEANTHGGRDNITCLVVRLG